MSQSTCDDSGKLVLRLAVGILVLLHGIAKLSSGVGGIEGMLVAKGLPGFFAWGLYLGEVLGPILLIVGVYARIGAALVAINMLFAIVLAHSSQIFQIGKMGGWAIELQAMFLFGSIAIVLLGAGRFSWGGSGGRWN